MQRPQRPKNPLIDRAIKLVGKQSILAQRIGCVQQTVSKMLHDDMPIPAELAVKIHEVTEGRVSKSALRPDLFGRRPAQADTNAAA